MQRWFYATEELVCDHTQLVFTPSVTENEEEPPKLRPWRFCVKVCDRELLPNEALAISGDCDQLGNWQFENCVLMFRIMDACQDKWHVFIDIPEDTIVSYRYLIVAIDPEGDQMIVRFFESHLKPRKVQRQREGVVDVCEDVFGIIKDLVKVERGWLTTERIVQLMFFKAPFRWLDCNFNDHVMQVKVTPAYRIKIGPCPPADKYLPKTIDAVSKVKETKDKEIANEKFKCLIKCCKMVPSFTKLNLQDCKEMFPKIENTNDEANDLPAAGDGAHNQLLTTQTDEVLSTAYAFNEVVNFNHQKDILKQQPTFGTPCGKQDMTLFHLTIGDFVKTVYLIELFTYSKHAAPDENPYLVGYCYLLPEDMESTSSGYIEASIMCASKHRLLGRMQFRFLVICPADDLKFDLSISYLRHWNSKRKPLDIGHRGQGRTYKSADGKLIHENTIHSIKMAVDNGADMVEFDVHLTKDTIPVINHDFNVQVSQTNPRVIQTFKSINIPLNKLSYKELRNLGLPKNVKFQTAPSKTTGVGDTAELRQLFPLLSDVMDACDDDIAYDIEIKWPQQFCNGRWEEGVKPRFDRNLYIDRILKVIMQKARNRRIVLSTFDADMCSMLRFKQNLFPVMFLLPEETEKPYLDARSNLFSTAIHFAYSMELLGVIPHANTLRSRPLIIGENHELTHLTIFCYGIMGNEDTSELKDMGVSAVILDRMDQLSKQDECTCSCCPESDAEETDSKAGGDSSSFESCLS